MEWSTKIVDTGVQKEVLPKNLNFKTLEIECPSQQCYIRKILVRSSNKNSSAQNLYLKHYQDC